MPSPNSRYRRIHTWRHRRGAAVCSPRPSSKGPGPPASWACQNEWVPSITDILWCAVMAASMALAVVFAFWYFRRIRDGRINPIVAPDWTSIERPASPPTGLQWGSGEQRDLDDDSHIGRPFPPAG